MFNILIIALCILFFSLRYISYCYYSFSIFIAIILLILTISLIKINYKTKLLVIIIILFYFKNTLITIYKTLFYIYRASVIDKLENRKDDTELRDIVNKIYEPYIIIKKDFQKLPNEPSIIVCNYCNDRLENLACILIPKNLGIISRDGLKNKLHRLIKWPIYTKKNNNYENTKKEILKHISEGRSIFSFVTQYRNYEYPKYSFKVRKGLFNIAKELNIPITLVAIDYIDIENYIIKKQNFGIRIGDTFKIDDINISILKAKNFFRNTLKEFEKNKYNF